MRKREAIQLTQAKLLDVNSTQEAAEVFNEHLDRLKLHENASDSPKREFQKSKSVTQPIYSALGELAWRKITNEMASAYAASGSLERLDGENNEAYSKYSPTLQRFMATMDAWLRPALQEIFDEAARGEMPQAAIYELAKPAKTRRTQSSEKYQKPFQIAAGRGWVPSPEVLEDFLKEAWTTLNIGHITSGILGRAIVAGRDGVEEGELVPLLLNDVDRIAHVSSLLREMNTPISTSEEFLDWYSRWERGECGAVEFLEYCNSNPWCTKEALHPKLAEGRWRNPGHCTSDMHVARPERFPVHPERFLRLMGVNDLGDITFTKLYVASAIVAARGTILTVLPRY